MLKANLGKKLTIQDKNDGRYTGVLEKIEKGFFILKTQDAWLNFEIGSIHLLEFKETPNSPDETKTIHDTITKIQKGIQINFKANNAKQILDLMYLQKGIGWNPTYHLELKDDKSAKLRLQAEVFNNAEDIENAQMNFVVGLPNFIHENQLSPMSMLTNLNDFLRGLSSQMESRFDDFANRGRSLMAYESDAEMSGNNESSGDIEGSQTEDLFFYTANSVSLKKGDRAIFPILESEVPIQHFYEVRLNEVSADNNYYRDRQNEFLSFEDNFKNVVWHSVKIKNSAKSPLSSGSVLVTKNENGNIRPICQDKISYTPIGAETIMRLTNAPDVSVKDFEKVKEIQENAYQHANGYRYDLVTVSGEVNIVNYKDKKIDLNVKRRITGKLLESSPKWLSNPILSNQSLLNKATEVCWELSLKAGEKLTIRYEYQFYAMI
jgi:hypothetical protein